VSVAHAEALADAMGDIVLQSIATKTDLRELEINLRGDLKDTELRLTLRMAAMLVFVVAVLSALKIFA
jgi:hypothetical protein